MDWVEKGHMGTSSLSCDSGSVEAKYNNNRPAHLSIG